MRMQKYFILVAFCSVISTSIALAAKPPCTPPVVVAEFLKEGTAVLVCKNGIATINAQRVPKNKILEVLERELSERPQKLLRVAIEIGVEKELLESLMSLSANAPKGSGTFMFADELWFGSMNEMPSRTN